MESARTEIVLWLQRLRWQWPRELPAPPLVIYGLWGPNWGAGSPLLTLGLGWGEPPLIQPGGGRSWPGAWVGPESSCWGHMPGLPGTRQHLALGKALTEIEAGTGMRGGGEVRKGHPPSPALPPFGFFLLPLPPLFSPFFFVFHL